MEQQYKRCQHVMIAYGKQLGYHHGAKYQILSCWERYYRHSDRPLQVVTDKPELFDGYPVEILAISTDQKFDWSLSGVQHFGIKLKGLEWAMHNQDAEITLLLDTDTFWIKDPRELAEQIQPGVATMYSDEGRVFGNRNKSISKFPESLLGKTIKTNRGTYQLSQESKMLNSSMIGLHREDIAVLSHAHTLFSALEPLVDAHTVEQFSLGEALRLHNFNIKFGKSFTRDWSSTGRKEYVTPLLNEFFSKYGENNFKKHLEEYAKIKIRRPFIKLLKQKIHRLRK